MDWKEVLWMGLVMVMLAAALIVVIGGMVEGITYLYEKAQCNQAAELNTDFEYAYKWPMGCVVRAPNGMFVSTENAYQYFEYTERE